MQTIFFRLHLSADNCLLYTCSQPVVSVGDDDDMMMMIMMMMMMIMMITIIVIIIIIIINFLCFLFFSFIFTPRLTGYGMRPV